ncbi:MAG TPA: hypothetical protein VF543_22600 [Pyrinomonadaceae bacterium]|jgi:hypothetical protein
MKLRKLLQVATLTLLIAITVKAGEMNNPGITKPPVDCSDPTVQCTQSNSDTTSATEGSASITDVILDYLGSLI